MKKVILSSALLIVGLAATCTMAATIPSGEYLEIFPTDTVADGDQRTAGTGPAYWVWTEDVNRTIWNVSWTGGGVDDLFSFTGSIYLQGSTGDFTTFDFEYSGTTYVDQLLVNGAPLGDGETRAGDYSTIAAYASDLFDGFQIVLTPDWTLPSYIGFDLKAVEVNGNVVDMADRIYIGQANETVASLQEALGQDRDEDFRIAAPVPEPATMLLFGAGLAGLAGVSRKRKK